MSVESERSDESRRFEADLKRLLQTTYRPPEPREAFRDELLHRMKRKQAEVVVRYRRRTRIRRVAFASAITAAAASVALAFLPASPAPDGAPGASVRNTAEAAQPAVETTAQSRPSAVSAGAAAPSGADPFRPRVLGRLYVSTDGEARTRAAADDALALEDGVELHAVHEEAGVELAPGVHLKMEKGSAVRVEEDGVRVRHGLVSLRLSPDAEATDLHLPEHTVRVAPGGWVGLAVARADRYAEGGRPAPDVALMEGSARVLTGEHAVAMKPHHTYRLHPYPTIEALEGEALGEQQFRRDAGWMQPELVNYRTSGRR